MWIVLRVRNIEQQPGSSYIFNSRHCRASNQQEKGEKRKEEEKQ
jgi:hypothetical protein